MSESTLESTRRIAFSFLEDLDELQRIRAAGFLPRGPARRASAILCRALEEPAFKDMARHRRPISRLIQPKLSGYYVEKFQENAAFFVSGGATVGGVLTRSDSVMVYDRPDPALFEKPIVSEHEVKVSQFCSSRVLFFRGTWFSRSEVIDYFRNTQGGSHFGSVKTTNKRSPSRTLLEEMNRALERDHNGGQILQTTSGSGPMFGVYGRYEYDSEVVTLPFIELCSAIHWFLESPQIKELVDVILLEKQKSRENRHRL